MLVRDRSEVPVASTKRAARPAAKPLLLVLDFDGLLINSYQLLRSTFEDFGLDVGDEDRFKHRRKFLKYLGGGKEMVRNFVTISLPKKKRIRDRLTEEYLDKGRIYAEFEPLLNKLIASPSAHVGIVSRNFTYSPGLTIRTVLRNSGVDEANLDFVIPVPTGVKKSDVLEAMKSSRYRTCLFGGDEVGDFRAATETGYESVIASYGFDSRERLIEVGQVPPYRIHESPAALAATLSSRVDTLLIR